MTKAHEKESKAMCYFLRHSEKAGLPIDKDGFMLSSVLIAEMNKKFPNFNMDILKEIVADDEKGRYSFGAATANLLIRANQGHSNSKVQIKFEKKIPPVTLYHGTDSRGFEGIQKTGIQKMKRHHVHLTEDPDTASSVGIRHGSEVLITIDTREMVKDGIEFFRSENGVWLTNFVDIKYFSDVKRKK